MVVKFEILIIGRGLLGLLEKAGLKRKERLNVCVNYPDGAFLECGGDNTVLVNGKPLFWVESPGVEMGIMLLESDNIAIKSPIE